MVLPMRRVWLAVAARVKPRNPGESLLSLHLLYLYIMSICACTIFVPIKLCVKVIKAMIFGRIEIQF